VKAQIGFDTFYVAFLVFKELGLIEVKEDVLMEISQNGNEKRNLFESKLYNKLLLIKKSMEKK